MILSFLFYFIFLSAHTLVFYNQFILVDIGCYILFPNQLNN